MSEYELKELEDKIFELESEVRYLYKKINSLEVYQIEPEVEFSFSLREDLINDKRFLPTKAEPHATGYDVRAAQKDRKPLIVRPGQYIKIELGFRGFCPEGWYYQLHPRSSFFAKKHVHNLIGIVDETWEGYTMFVGQYVPDISSMGSDLVIEFGDAVGQIIPVKRQDVKIIEVSDKEYNKLCKDRGGVRKTGGFGSTSKK